MPETIRKIDVHTHILPRDWPDLNEKYAGGGWLRLDHHQPCCARMMIDGRSFREVESNLWDPTRRQAECDECGVNVQVLSTVPVMFSYWAEPEAAHELSRILNDHIAEVCREFPDRFLGLGTLPMQSPERAVKELERCVNELGLRGVEIGTHVNDWNLNAPQVVEVFEAAEELGASIFVHPWDMMGQDEMPQYWLPWLVGMPGETARAICCMIFGGVFERLPNLRVLFAHGGGAFPFTIGRIEHGHRVRPDLCAVDCPTSPREFLGRFWVDSLVHDPAALNYLISVVGETKVALGSDYPFPLGEACPGELIERAGLPRSTVRALLAENPKAFLGLDWDVAAASGQEDAPAKARR